MTEKLGALPRSVWNLVAIFFLGWFVLATWLLGDGDQSPLVRFAFALAGSLSLFAGSAGGGLCYLAKFIKRFSSWITILILIGFLLSIFLPVINAGYAKARAASSVSALKQSGLAILIYAEHHNDALPPKMKWEAMEPQLRRYFDPKRGEHPSNIDPASGEPFVWRRVFGGFHLSDIKAPDKVIIAYSQPYNDLGDDYRSVLFLDGHTKRYSDSDFWKVWSAQPELPSRSKSNSDSGTQKKIVNP